MSVITGTAGNDVLNGTAAADIIDGAGGNDTIHGGAGNDTLLAGPGDDYYEGDDHTDSLNYGSAPSAVNVTKPQSDAILGTASDGFGGTDSFFHGTADQLVGSAYDDTLTGSPNYVFSGNGETFGSDWILGGHGNDSISGLGNDDVLLGQAGHDTLRGGDGIDELWGGTGNDLLDGGAGMDFITYEDAFSAVDVNLATGTATGGGGDDVLEGIEEVVGSEHNDTLE